MPSPFVVDLHVIRLVGGARRAADGLDDVDLGILGLVLLVVRVQQPERAPEPLPRRHPRARLGAAVPEPEAVVAGDDPGQERLAVPRERVVGGVDHARRLVDGAPVAVERPDAEPSIDPRHQVVDEQRPPVGALHERVAVEHVVAARAAHRVPRQPGAGVRVLLDRDHQPRDPTVGRRRAGARVERDRVLDDRLVAAVERHDPVGVGPVPREPRLEQALEAGAVEGGGTARRRGTPRSDAPGSAAASGSRRRWASTRRPGARA